MPDLFVGRHPAAPGPARAGGKDVMTTEEKRALARRHREERWHAHDAPCGICGRVDRLVPIDSKYVVLSICLACANARLRSTRREG